MIDDTTAKKDLCRARVAIRELEKKTDNDDWEVIRKTLDTALEHQLNANIEVLDEMKRRDFF